tara:strand:+ start:13989 stop:14846 length:858 start_codon:yes stop_codon:yes gene_type:complete
MNLDLNKKYLITGGSGFLGRGLISKLEKDNIKNLIVVSRNESELMELKQKFPYVEILTGDISDHFILEKASVNVDGIFHLAAFKHVVLAEDNTTSCIKSNVLGTMNVLNASLKHKMDFVIGISTDKAAQVNGVYGATKFLQEKLFKEYGMINDQTKYRTVRYGNVLYSTGSVLCKWKKNIQNNKEIIITEPNATRFYWSIEDAVDLIFNCLKFAKNSDPYLPEMKSMKMGDLLEAMMKKYSNGNRPNVKKIGLQRGENLHEIISENMPNSNDAQKYTIEEIIKLI